MTDDIVTRLRNHVRGDFEKTSEFMLRLAADEIERLRAELTTAQTMWMLEEAQKNKWKSLCQGIVEAITDEGREPAFHHKIMAKHRSEWKTLWERIDKTIRAVRGE